jgi:VWFA-related protein
VSAAFAVQQNPPAVFRSGTDLVRFDVRVIDASGRPITDLRADEIAIVEDGAPRPILLFQHFAEPAEAYADAQLRAVSAEVSSNRGAPRGHLYMMVFDQSHIASGNEQIARRAAERFITRHVRPSDRMAIVGLPGPGPLSGFTADRAHAIHELEKVRGGFERDVTTAVGQFSVHEAYEMAAGNDDIITQVANSGIATKIPHRSAAPSSRTREQWSRRPTPRRVISCSASPMCSSAIRASRGARSSSCSRKASTTRT